MTEHLLAEDSGTLADTAFRSLRKDIIRGVRQPDERLRIERLRQIYGIGPTPLREALQRLNQDGLVRAEGNRGFTVAPLNPAEFADLNIARTSVEKETLRLSLTQGGDEWEAGVVAASYLMRKEDEALARAGGTAPDSWEMANGKFHLSLVSACGSAWLLRVRALLHDLCERYRRVSVSKRPTSRDLASEHAAIAEAALARDIERTCDLTAQHFALTAAILAETDDG
ncbi:MAG: FCD domain-containing protein [Alphaproteobacteria bacterium]